jgi:hypothetical protein
VEKLVKINDQDRLYVLRCGKGYTCLGFDYARKQTASVAAWLGRPELAPASPAGTPDAYAEYEAAMAAGAEHNRATGERCNANLTPELVGLEGKRVAVYGNRPRRFIVGKSSGWMPCHLEIARRNCYGGQAVIHDFVSARVVG